MVSTANMDPNLVAAYAAAGLAVPAAGLANGGELSASLCLELFQCG